ncbi:interleukin-18 isoform X4 [Myotis myotis]|uniref:Interleukin-18 n=1 Tax=Myotis myotis TaxID=51298 RepID=A0A7J7VHM4_MYOMY|nr:interleukin-18 isoform X4 [Myotis myotis]XP_036180267.1 interleukin-18 isoform X4 [Myotis myotis]KAF6324652.1 interleukin 18 [Myotis myotis]
MYPALSFWHSERIIPYLVCEPLTDVQIIKENLESDYFSRFEPRLSVIRNLNDQVLFVSQRSQAVFEDMTDSECEENASLTKIIIYTYKDSYPRGMAVSLSVKCPDMLTLSCMNKDISFKKMSPPADINDEKSDIIFFMRSVPGSYNKMRFESSLYEGYFLACKKEGDLFKLILKEKDIDWDDSVMFTVDDKELNIKIS